MHRLALRLTIPILPFLFVGAAQAQAPTAPTTTPSGVTVVAPDRMICRRVTGTTTRMRSGRICRSVPRSRGTGPQSDEDRVAEAADTLDAFGERMSTDCIGGSNFRIFSVDTEGVARPNATAS